MEAQRAKTKRLQHPGFGLEIRALLRSRDTAGQELAGIIVNEIEALVAAKDQNRPHPHEDRLNGKGLDDISYLRLYKGGMSSRVYFAVIDGTIWMLALDANKRTTKLSDGTTTKLLSRLREARQATPGRP